MADSALPPSRFGSGFTAGHNSSTGRGAPAAAGPSPAPAVSRLAVVTFTASLALGLVVAPLTLPLSFVAHRQVVDTGRSGGGLAKASMAISGIYLVVGVVVMGLYVYRVHLSAGQ
ncbi:hypothetical protein ACQI4L_19610 [Mycolicibacterium litorale]|uniref:hypothetical protein n=1 Tax=Mycolicibacterium litorale TaxID=758802 RepID=UPI003CF2C147